MIVTASPFLNAGLRRLRSFCFAAFCMLVLVAETACAGEVTLAWDPNTEADLAGYKIHYGTASGVYGHSVDVGNATAYQLSGLTKGQVYYLVVTAVNGSNTESDYSNELSGAAE